MTNAGKTMSQYERHRLNVRRYGQVNKVAIFDALAAQNILHSAVAIGRAAAEEIHILGFG